MLFSLSSGNVILSNEDESTRLNSVVGLSADLDFRRAIVERNESLMETTAGGTLSGVLALHPAKNQGALEQDFGTAMELSGRNQGLQTVDTSRYDADMQGIEYINIVAQQIAKFFFDNDAPEQMLRVQLGGVLRDLRGNQDRTLRNVADKAGISLGYLSEIERGKKEASSELLNAICGALRVPLFLVLQETSMRMARAQNSAVNPSRMPNLTRK